MGIIGTRVTDIGTFTLRVETDFAGPNGFRIRHAYGEFENLLVGQTWSIFSHVTIKPYTIDVNGPLGVARNLTPQVRYRLQDVWPSADLTLGVEFPQHTFTDTDGNMAEEHQLLPDPSVRVRQVFSWGELQSSLIIPFLSGSYGPSNNVEVSVGWGLSSTAAIKTSDAGLLIIHAAAGQGISDLFSTFAGRGQNVHVNAMNVPELAFVVAGHAAYEHRWDPSVRSTVIVSAITKDGRAVLPRDFYQWGWSTSVNTFWDIYDGLHAGAEITFGGRIDANTAWGTALRTAGLLYYEL